MSIAITEVARGIERDRYAAAKTSWSGSCTATDIAHGLAAAEPGDTDDQVARAEQPPAE